jgi:GNAT superfamily N-acetyltransferase
VGFDIIAVTDRQGGIVAPDLLPLAERVHCQLRPHLAGRYVETMRRVVTDGAEMCVLLEGGEIRAVSLFRVYENTFAGMHMYVDDLVTDESNRSRGAGRTLLNHLQQLAVTRGCDNLVLDSGTHRTRAHAFYFREGFSITSFHFVKRLK